MITFDNVAKRYPNGRAALAGVTFTIQPGERIAQLIVVPVADLDRVEAAGAHKGRRLAEFAYLNEAGLRLRSFLWPDPARDVQRIVLVATRD